MRLAFAAIVSLGLCAAQKPVEFNRDVRPILSDKCFLCHGPDAAAKNVPRRLDVEADARADRAGIRAVVSGDTEASEMVRRITAVKPALRMPPVYSGLTLAPAEIETLRTWIAQGAKWQKHWSFLPPVRPEVPTVAARAWVRNPIDSFILARLERESLKPSQEATRETLLRRVSLDLTGLPPSVADLETFLADKSAQAYEHAVDRLLASPRYGERMATPWLDAARYADTNGYQYDGERYMWRWRDWVIEAFNRNLPYDKFAVEQIAGDLLPGATLDQKIASGFNRNHRANTEDGIIADEYAVEYVVDRVETTSTVFLGLTLGCARCHNHKYDPFSQKEFYRFFAYFNNVPELGRAMKYGNSPPMLPAPTRDQQAQLAAVDARIRDAERVVDQRRAEIDRALPASAPQRWGPAAGLDGWAQVSPVFDGKTMQDLGQVAQFDIDDRFTLSAWIYSDTPPDGPVATRMTDKPKGKGFGLHMDQGRVYFHLTSDFESDALKVETEEKLEAGRWYHVVATYTGSRMAEGATVYIDGKPAKLRVLQDNLYRPFRNAGRKPRDPFRIGGGDERRFRGMIQDARAYSRILRLDEIEAMSATPGSAADSNRRRWYFLENTAPEDIRAAWSKLTALRLDREKLERTFPTVMVMAELPQRRDTFLLIRGAYDKPGEKVERGVPAALPPLPAGAPDDRLGLARWLVDPANPMTARVEVNRLWQMVFGAGLVKSVEDFGAQGEWPSHPELLDWLAMEFVRTGWDVKAMLKLIVTSATYRQMSSTTPELLQRDPDNRLLARGPRFRLPAEMVRDQALAASGLLTEKLGGPSVKPYQSADLWKDISMQDMDYNQSKGGDLYRRGLYTFWKRTIAPPSMMNFDAANREACVVRQSRTNTPLQALNLMNDVTFVEAARFVGQRMMKEGGASAEDRLRYGFRLVLARWPSAEELNVLRGSLNHHRDYFAGKDAEVSKFLNLGDTRADARLDPRDLASYAAVASLILNLDEAVTKE